MKILFDATELSYYNENSGHKAGVFYVAINLFKEFQKQGVELTLCCDFKRYYFLKHVIQNTGINATLLKENSLSNRFIGKLLYLTRNFPIKLRYLLLILSRYYEKYCYKKNNKNTKQLEGFDAYFSPYTPPVDEIQHSSLKKFRMLHDTIPIIENGMPKSPKDWFYKIYNSINEDDFYVTNSNYTRQDIIKHFSCVKDEHITTTLLGANENFAPLTNCAPVEGKYIFSLCTLGKRKNLEFAIDNFFKFIQKHNIDDLKLVLGGSIWESYKNKLNSILDKHDSSKIILTGYIEEQELARYYSNALCFIYPSLYEGFGLPVLEAMQCGCPVITSSTTSLPEVIGDAGIQITPTDDKQLISAYEKMYFDQTFREECRSKGIERAKLFSWEKCATEILDFIELKL